MIGAPIITAEAYAHVMRIVSPLLALAFWALSVWFISYGRRYRVWRRFLGMFAWTINVAIFWTLLAYFRLAAGSIPAAWITVVNFWSVVLYLQAAFSMLFGLIFLHQISSPRDTDTRYSSPEIGPDDE